MSPTPTWERPGTAVRYLVAVAAWAVALGLTMSLAPHLARTIFLFFWAAVIFAAWFGGFGPALLVSVLSVIAAAYYLVPPYGRLVPTDPGDLIPLALFVVLSAVISRLTGDLRRAEERSAQTARELQARTRLLEEQATELEQQREEAQVLAEELEQTNEELRAANEEAERERDRSHGVLAGISDAYVFLDPEWRVVEVNPAAERLLGRPAAELVGRSHWEEWPASLGSELERQYRRAMAEQVPVHFAHHYRDPTFDFHLETDAYPSPEGLAVFFRDITERLRAEDELRLFKLLSDHSNDAHFLLDPAGRILYANRLACERLGYAGDELVGLSISQIDPSYPADRYRDLFERARRERVPPLEGLHRRRDGSSFPVEVTVTVLERPQGPIMLAASRDITERRHAEAERQHLLEEADAARRDAERAQHDAEEASQAKSQFLANMSHEIRTPINAVMGYADLMQAGIAGPLTERQEGYLERVKASSRHLLGLVDDVLDLSKVEAGRLEVAREHGHADGVIAAATSLVQPQADTRRIALENLCAQDCEYPYYGDENRVRQVLVNLLSNAVKFTEPGGRVTVTAELTSTPDAEAHLPGPGPWTCVRVADTGIGIAPEQIEAVFRAFVQAEAGRTRTKGGTGLGLTISREFARLMGGDLTVRSTPGQGATFSLWLPTQAAETSGGAPARGAARAGEAIQTELDGLIRAYATRLRADPTLPQTDDVLRADLEDHTAAFLADIAQALVIVEEGGGDTGLLRDGSDVQRLISERHGAQRRRLGWTEEALRREYRILEEEVEGVVRGAFAAGDPAADRAMELLSGLLAQAERASIEGMRSGSDGPPGLLDWTRDTIEATRRTIDRVKRAVVGDGAGAGIRDGDAGPPEG